MLEEIMQPFMELKSPIRIVETFFQTSHLHGLLARLDRAAMAFGVEARVPFVDHNLVEILHGTPALHRTTQYSSKVPLRKIVRNLLGEDISQRQKIGFPVVFESTEFNNPGSRFSAEKWLLLNYESFEAAIRQTQKT
jgi:asparagine synthase (glutamine-hydrolysing)